MPAADMAEGVEEGKGFFPYETLRSFEDLEATSLPPPDKWTSSLQIFSPITLCG